MRQPTTGAHSPPEDNAMLIPHKVAEALAAKRPALRGFAERLGKDAAAFRLTLAELSASGSATVLAAVSEVDHPGALPTPEVDAGILVPFAPSRGWGCHEEARGWALKALAGKPTLAVDGSQVPVSKDYAPMVGAVQVAWFLNPHDAGTPYEKDLRFEVIAPDELLGDPGGGEGPYPQWLVNFRRFDLETATLSEWMTRDASPKPVCFLDGSLVVSFAGAMRPERRDPYIRAVSGLIEASVAHRAPLVGFVADSAAKDLLGLLRHWKTPGGSAPSALTDAELLRPLMQWGDRSAAFVCARDDGTLEHYRDSAGLPLSRAIGFTYLQLSGEGAPARVEFPLWILEAGLLEPLIDVVRAEAIVGVRYPYCLETADAAALISAQDRERFYRILQGVLREDGLELEFSRKAWSKLVRR